jgi:gamma-glutamylcyclotransferase (GGCT)/AIG2-like uncharacterized protein YtfP
MSCNIFTYGSLMFPQVWERVVHARYRSMRAVAFDHARFAIAGETYPGMVAQAGATVQGVLYFDVNAQDAAALDAFEGSDYRRELIQARLESGETVTAGTYLYLNVTRLADTPWRPEVFELQRFLQVYCGGKLAE